MERSILNTLLPACQLEANCCPFGHPPEKKHRKEATCNLLLVNTKEWMTRKSGEHIRSE
jgi:hypothetical protein